MLSNIYDLVRFRREAIEDVIQKNYGYFSDEFMKEVFKQRDCLDSQLKLLYPYVNAIDKSEKNKSKK